MSKHSTDWFSPRKSNPETIGIVALKIVVLYGVLQFFQPTHGQFLQFRILPQDSLETTFVPHVDRIVISSSRSVDVSGGFLVRIRFGVGNSRKTWCWVQFILNLPAVSPSLGHISSSFEVQTGSSCPFLMFLAAGSSDFSSPRANKKRRNWLILDEPCVRTLI